MNTEFSGFVKLFVWGYNTVLLRCMEKSYELVFCFCLIDLFLTAYTNIFFHTSLKCYFSHLNLFVNVLDTKTGWLVLVCFVVLLKKSLIKWALILSFYYFSFCGAWKHKNCLSDRYTDGKILPTQYRCIILSSFTWYLWSGKMGCGFNLNNFIQEKSVERYIQGDLLWPQESLEHKLLKSLSKFLIMFL